MEIKYAFNHEEKKIVFTIDDQQKTLLLEGDSNNDIVELYDLIIDNIKDISFVDETPEADRKESVALDAFELIINKIKEETQKIKSKYDDMVSSVDVEGEGETQNETIDDLIQDL